MIEDVVQEREAVYGSAKDNHGLTADMFDSWHTRRRFRWTPLEVCAFNIIQKLSRLAHSPTHKDSWVDIAGYAENALRILEEGNE